MSGSGFGSRLFDLTSEHAPLVALTCVALVGAGVLTAFSLPSGIYPELDFPRIVVVARSADEPPEQVEATIARPIESELATVPGIVRMRTKIIRGTSETAVQFEEGADMIREEQLARQALASARDALPDGVSLEVERITPADFPILSFDLTGGTGVERREIAETVVRPALARAEGVGAVGIVGGDVRELDVLVDPARLVPLHVRPSQLAETVSDALVRRAVGRRDDSRKAVTLLAETGFTDATGLSRLPVAAGPLGAIPLSAVADVREGVQDRTRAVHAKEGDAVQVDVARRVGASTPDVVRGVHDAIAGIVLPRGLKLVEAYDQGALIDASVRGIRDAILIGIALTVAVLAAFLREPRSGAVAALSVPFALAATFVAMKLLGQTLNLMSLGGMAIAIGIVIDDAVVVVEAIVRHAEEGLPPRAATRQALDEMAGPVIGTTITTVVVLLPLAMLGGVAGSFFRALAITLASAVLASLLFALVALPLLASKVLRPGRKHAQGLRLATRHAVLVRRLMARPALAVAALVALGAGGALMSRGLLSGFLPEMDEGAFVLDYFLPAGSSLQETESAALKVEAVLATTQGVATWSRRTGAELGPITATETHRGDIVVRLVPRGEREEAEAIIESVRARLASEAPGVRFEFVQILEDVVNDLAGNPRPIEIRMIGPDRDALKRLASEVAGRVGDVPGLVDYDPGVEAPATVVRHVIDAGASAHAGLTPADVVDELTIGAAGTIAGTVPRRDRLVPVRVRLGERWRESEQALASVPLSSATGVVTLGALAPGHEDLTATTLVREDLSPAVLASADVENADLAALVRSLRAKLGSLTVPAGHRVEVGGRIESRARALVQLMMTLGAGLTCVLAVLLAQLRSLRASLLVLLSVPLALVGVVAMLVVTRTPLDVSSAMGVVLLAGLVVKNGILLLHEALRLQRAGMPRGPALVAAGRQRLRPILMTTLCTVFGLLPLALAIGAGSELQRPLAIAVIGGLVTSTIATLLLLPAIARRVLAPTA